MAEGMNLPSMFDTQYAMGRQMEEDAFSAGQLPLGGGMMYASSMKGDLENAQLMSLAGMMGGKGDPRMEKQKTIERVMQEFGKQPETIEDYKTIARMFNGYGEYGFAEKAMEQVREIQKNATQTTYKTEKVGIMKNGQRYTQTWKVDNAGNYIKLLGEQLTSEPSSSTASIPSAKEDAYALFLKSTDYINATDKAAAIQDWESGYARDLLKPTAEDTPPVLLGKFTRLAKESMLEQNPDIDPVELTMLSDEKGQEDYDDYLVRLEQREKAGTYSPLQLQGMINPATLAIDPFTEKKGLLYDPKLPNGRNYTEPESLVAAQEYKRINSDEVFQQMSDEANFKDVNATLQADNLIADGAASELIDLQQMLDLLEGGATTNWGQDWKLGWAGLFDSLGFTQGELSDNEILRTKMKTMALARLGFLKGAASDKDIEFVEAAGAQMNKSKDANTVILRVSQILANQTVDNNNHMNQWVQAHKDNNKGRSPSSTQYRNELIRFKNRGLKMKNGSIAPLREGETALVPISTQIKTTMEEVLNITPDLDFNQTIHEYTSNTVTINALKEKYSKKE